MLTIEQLSKINARRRQKRLRELSMAQAQQIAASRPADSDSDAVDFVIGYATGIPMPSVGGIVGAMMHDSGPSDSGFSGGGGDSGGGGGCE